MAGLLMNNELERICKEAVLASSRYSGTFLEGLRKATKSPSSVYPVPRPRFEPNILIIVEEKSIVVLP
jgi:hypothetical protein